MEKNRKILLAIVALSVLIGGAWYLVHSQTKSQSSSAASTFAQCIKDSGTKFYGAFWCPHCQEQEHELQQSRTQLAAIGLYTECSLPDGQHQTPICIKEKITSYPTWVFPDHSTSTGVLSLQTLSEKTGCSLPASQ